MKIAILGAGKTGSYVASILSQEEYDVTLFEKSSEVLEQASREEDVATLISPSLDDLFLSRLLEIKPDLFFAATGDDATNLMACSLAKNGGVSRTVARVQSLGLMQSKNLSFNRLFYVDHFLCPELIAAEQLFKMVVHSTDSAFEFFAQGHILMRTIQLPKNCKQEQVLIKELRLPKNLMIGLIRRKNGKILFPHGEDALLSEDEVTFVGETKIMQKLDEIFQVAGEPVKSVILVGGSMVALHLASFLLKQKVSVRIFEKDRRRALELADLLPEATIICRDGCELGLLKQEKVEAVDAFICCMKEDGINLLISSVAKHLGCPKAIALVNDPAYTPLFEKAGVMAALAPRVNVANRLLSILHRNSVLSVASLFHDAAKIVELKVSPSSNMLGMPLSKLSRHLPKDFLIAVIENHGNVMVGRGDSVLYPEDRLIAICHPHHLQTVSELMT